MKPVLLLVDDDESIRTQMKWALADEYTIVQAGDRAEALESFRACNPAVVLLDLGLPPESNSPVEGLTALSELLAEAPHAKIVVITGQGEKENALKAVGAGAYDFLPKPVDTDMLKLVLQRCTYLAEIEREYRELKTAAPAAHFEGMLGASPVMQEVFRLIRKVARSSAPVLLLGESGTGKEMAAAAIHRQSERKIGPFAAINCNALPENLVESELFGHEKGAFTGAHESRTGLIETAARGTLFLDEIGDLPPPVQVKLLRFLQDQRFQRVGGREELQIDTRIVAATNVDLKGAIASGAFREDLYFRLAVVVIKLPALRERGGDIELIARDCLERYAAQHSGPKLSFTPAALRAINQHAWPGNVRELQNRVRRATIMAEGRHVTPLDLELDRIAGATHGPTLKEARSDVEREMIEQALQQHRGKIAPAAAALGISRPTFYELMEKHSLRKPGH